MKLYSELAPTLLYGCLTLAWHEYEMLKVVETDIFKSICCVQRRNILRTEGRYFKNY